MLGLGALAGQQLVLSDGRPGRTTSPGTSGAARARWDSAAATFDDEPDHGLLDPAVREAWRCLLLDAVPPPPARVLDLGCGTGSLSVLLAEMGHDVTGIDISPRMVEQATAKARRHAVQVDLHVGDAADPAVAGAFDVVLSRHLLWAVPDPAAAVARWFDLLTPDGRLVLVEGRWHTGTGLTAAEVTALVAEHAPAPQVRLLDDAALWGAPVTDERHLVLATR